MTTDEPQGKGRPTPTRKQANAGRKQGIGSHDAKAARERDRQRRIEARAGLLAGDPRYFPRRDAGPVREYVRDLVDSRRSMGEYFVLGAVGVMVFGLVNNKAVQQFVVTAWTAMLALVIVDTIYVAFRIARETKSRWPQRSLRRGVVAYGTLRTLQLRRFRIPPPRLAPGGKPVKPRKTKSARS